jgi:hypothetical protein
MITSKRAANALFYLRMLKVPLLLSLASDSPPTLVVANILYEPTEINDELTTNRLSPVAKIFLA